MTFRTNQPPHKSLCILGAEHAKSSNGWILEEFHFKRHDSFDFLRWYFVASPPLSIDTLDTDSSGGPGPLSGSG